MYDKHSYTGLKLIGAGALTAYNYYNRSRTGTLTATRRKKKSKLMSDNTFVTRARLRTGRKRKRSGEKAFRSFLASGQRLITRWEQTSATYLGPGKVFIGWGKIDENLDRLPIHFISLTNNPKLTGNEAKGAFKNDTMCRMYYNHVTGAYAWASDVYSSTHLGTVAPNAEWQYEHDQTCVGQTSPWSRCFHNWTDIRLNLYGTYSVPINYHVMLCTMKEQVDPFQFGQGVSISEGSECANMLKDWTRSQLHDTVSVNASPQTWSKDVRIIKEYRTTIQPLTPGDQIDVGNSSVASKSPHIKEIKWFVRHDRFRDYAWSRDAINTVEDRDFVNGGWDYFGPFSPLCDVEWGKRLFLVIRASCPSRYNGDPLYCDVPVLATVNGSYDLSIRNSFTLYH